ncbi:MAG: hypothetical protein QM817_00495 [Archangium sp.]
MRYALVAVLLAACSKTADERKKHYVEVVQREIDDASFSYSRFVLLKQGLAVETPECTDSTKFPTTFRLSMAHLELLNGAPHKDGVLVVDLPAPDGFDNLRGFPPKSIEPKDVSPAELDKLVRELRAADGALKNADGFLVQRVDEYVAPRRETGRIVVFDGAGKPTCHVPYSAVDESDAGVSLTLELRRAFRERLGVPE